MAAASLNTVRVRLYFDYPPPGVSDCRMCWLLVDLNKCRVVADLASVIKEKFDFSRRTILNLFIDDCYLPPTESVYVVRDNDSIRVKVENQPQVNGTEVNSKSEGLSGKAKKRIRDEEEDDNDESEGLKTTRKKKKKAPTESREVDPQTVRDGEQKKKKKKLKEKNLPAKPASPVKRTTPAKEPTTVYKSGIAKTAKKPVALATSAPSRAKQKAAASSSSSSDTSDSSEEEAPKKAVAVKTPSRAGGGVVAAPARAGIAAAAPARAGIAAAAPARAGIAAASSSSSDSSDSSTGPTATKPVPKKSVAPAMDFAAVLAVAGKPQISSPSSTPSSEGWPPKSDPTLAVTAQPRIPTSSADSDSDDGVDALLTNKRPGLGHHVPPPSPLATDTSGGLPLGGVTGRGGANPRGVGRGCSSWAGSRGRGGRGGGDRGQWRGRGWAGRGVANLPFHSGDQNGLGPQLQRHTDDTLTNKAVVLQNPPERAPVKLDYESMPLLAAPPQVGQKIAFKLLELTENYTPEVSDYKEGKIIAIDQSTKQVELELLSSAPAPAEPGKFDLVYQTPDGSEVVEYAVPRGSQLTERWDSLLEPRLIVENNV